MAVFLFRDVVALSLFLCREDSRGARPRRASCCHWLPACVSGWGLRSRSCRMGRARKRSTASAADARVTSGWEYWTMPSSCSCGGSCCCCRAAERWARFSPLSSPATSRAAACCCSRTVAASSRRWPKDCGTRRCVSFLVTSLCLAAVAGGFMLTHTSHGSGL